MVQQELLSYIKEQLPQYPEADLRKVLADAGWAQVDVDAAFASIAQTKAAPPPVVPVSTPAPVATPVTNPVPRVEIPVVADVARTTAPLTRPAPATAVNTNTQSGSIGYQRPVIAPVLQTTRIATPAATAAQAPAAKPGPMTRPPMMTSMLMNNPPDKLRVDENKRTPVLQVYRPQTGGAPVETHHNGSHVVLIVILILFLTFVGGSVYAFWAGLVPKPIVDMVQQVVPGFAKSPEQLNAEQIESMVPVKFNDGEDTQKTESTIPPVSDITSTSTAATTTAASAVTATSSAATSTPAKSTTATSTPKVATTTPSKPVSATSTTGTTTKAK